LWSLRAPNPITLRRSHRFSDSAGEDEKNFNHTEHDKVLGLGCFGGLVSSCLVLVSSVLVHLSQNARAGAVLVWSVEEEGVSMWPGMAPLPE
jgi:hypothetical protein